MRQVLLVLLFACVFSAVHAGRRLQPGKYASVSEALANVPEMKLKHRLSTTLAALKASGLEIPPTAEWTIFAPTNKAWADKDLFKETGLTAAELMLPENKDKLAQLLQHHIIPTAALQSAQLLPGTTLTTALAGAAPLRVQADDDDIEIATTYTAPVARIHIEDDSGDDDDDDDDDRKSEAEIKMADIMAGKAIIHSVNELLIPASLLLGSAPVDVPLPAASMPAPGAVPLPAANKPAPQVDVPLPAAGQPVQKTDRSKEE